MACLENFKELIKIMAQGVLQMRNELRIAADGPFETLESFACDTTRLERFVKAFQVAVSAKEFQEGLADHYVIRRSIVMKFLMPLFQKMPADLFDMMAVHDV